MVNNNILDAQFLTYVAGILIPTINISITTAFNSVPTASISMPAYPQLYGIGRQDKVPVTVFYKDNVTGDYILLFEGDVNAFSYTNSISSRDITINAHGILRFLDDVHVNFLSSLDDMTLAGVPGSKDTALQQQMPSIGFPASLYMYGLGDITKENMVKVPKDYMDNMVSFVSKTGSLGDWNNSALAEFYAKYCESIKLPNRYTAVPYFDEESSEVWGDSGDGVKAFPLIAGMQKEAALSTLVQITGQGMQAGGTITQLINHIVSQMEYEFAYFNAPYYDGTRMVSCVLKPMFYDAVPPVCNVLYRSQVLNVSTMEYVYEVPTRIRTKDINGVFSKLAGNVGSAVTEYGLIDYYPSKAFDGNDITPGDANGKTQEQLPNYFSSELLDGSEYPYDTETYTGPWVYETTLPAWASYVGPAAIGGNLKVFKQRLLARLLHHQQYSPRAVQSNCAFNPYVVPGFPGVLFDSGDTGFVFCGHVLTVSHHIMKSSMNTTVELGFVRLIEEAISHKMENPIPGVDKVTQDESKMSEVTNAVIGTASISWQTVDAQRENTVQQNVMDAYKAQYRKIITLDEYCSFMGVSKVMGTIGDNEEVPIMLNGEYFEKRRKPKPECVPPFPGAESGSAYGGASTDVTELRGILRTIAEREFSRPVYVGSDVVKGEDKAAYQISQSDAPGETMDVLAGNIQSPTAALAAAEEALANKAIQSPAAALAAAEEAMNNSAIQSPVAGLAAAEAALAGGGSLAEGVMSAASGVAPQYQSAIAGLAAAEAAMGNPATALSGIMSGGSGIMDTASSITGTVTEAISPITSAISTATGMVSTATGMVTGAVNTATGTVTGIVRGVTSNVNGIINGAIDTFVDPVQDFATSITGPLDDILDVAGVDLNLTRKVNNVIDDALDEALDPVQSAMKKVTKPIYKVVGEVRSTVYNKLDPINDANQMVKSAVSKSTSSVKKTTNALDDLSDVYSETVE